MEISSQALGIFCGLCAIPAGLVVYGTVLQGGMTGRPVSPCTAISGLALPLMMVVVGGWMCFFNGGVQLLKLPMYPLVCYIACRIFDKVY